LVVDAIELADNLGDLVRAVEIEGRVTILLDRLGVVESVRSQHAT